MRGSTSTQLRKAGFGGAAKQAALLLCSIAGLLAGGAAGVRGQSARDGFDPSANGIIHAIVVQPDGKVLIGGDFTSLSPNGGASVARNYIARLNPDGTLDANFNPNASGEVAAIAVQADGKVLAGGSFTSIGGQTRNFLARLDATNGTADSFNPNPNSDVAALAVQADGKILVGGDFNQGNGTPTIGGATRNNIARLDATTGLADTFNPNAGSTVYAIVVQADGKVLAGGDFNSIGGQTRHHLARLDPTTGLADSFDPEANLPVLAIAVQADGKVLAGGQFTSLSPNVGAALTRYHIARLFAPAQVTMTPLSSFGGGDGWLAPGEGSYAYLGTNNNERGLAYGNGHLYLVSHASISGTTANVRMLDALSGADLGGLNNSGISGGTFVVNAIGVGGDGAIYVGNLTTQSTTSPLKIYQWASEGSAPTVAYSGNGGLEGCRLGDSLAVIGSGTTAVLAAGYNTTPTVAGNNGYAIIDPTAGTATAVGFSAAPPNAGDFRLGLTFVNSSHVLGTAGSSLYRDTSFSATSGTLLGSPAIPDPAGATADRMMACTVLGGRPLLAVQSIGDSHVSLYDMTDPLNPVYLISGNNTSGTLTANGNATGQEAWGPITANSEGTVSETLYAMSSNQGIQAFVVTIPMNPPAFTGLVRQPGGLLLQLQGGGGIAYTLLVSSNLTHWNPLTNLTAAANGLFQYLDPATNAPNRFYRLSYP